MTSMHNELTMQVALANMRLRRARKPVTLHKPKADRLEGGAGNG
jgi:hypothetical protein